MELDKVMAERFSVRDYKDTAIEEEKLNAILEAGRIAPTAANIQPQRVYVIKSEEGLSKIRAITHCAFNAPVVLMVAYDADKQWKNPLEEGICAGLQDVSIVTTQMMLKAWDLGIGSCWVNHFPPTETAKAFGLPENEKVALLLPIGYPADDAVPAPMHAKMKDMDDLVKYL